MQLDPCPWCGKHPYTFDWVEYSRSLSIDPETFEYIPTEYEMINIACCHASLTCAKIDAEEMWNWIDDFRLRSGRTTRQSNQDSLPVVYTEWESKDTDQNYRD